MAEDNLDELTKVKQTLQVREHQLKEMATMIADLNDQLNNSLLKQELYFKENNELKEKLKKKTHIVDQYSQDKELMFSKLQQSERENDRLKKQLTSNYNENQNKNIFTNIWSKLNKKQELINDQIQEQNLQNQLFQKQNDLMVQNRNSEKDLDQEDILQKIRNNLDLE